MMDMYVGGKQSNAMIITIVVYPIIIVIIVNNHYYYRDGGNNLVGVFLYPFEFSGRKSNYTGRTVVNGGGVFRCCAT